MRGAGHRGETIRRSGDLAGGVGVDELAGIRPHEHRHAFTFLVTGRQVDRAAKLHAILALVGHEHALGGGDLRMRILEAGDRLRGSASDIAHEVVCRLHARLRTRQRLRALIIQQQDDTLERISSAAEEPFRHEGLQIQSIQKWPIALRRGPLADQID